MNLEALTLLETPTVRRLVATWPRVGDYATTTLEICKKWSIVSGLHFRLAWKWYNPLLVNQIINLDGTIDNAAADYIAQCALSQAKFARERKQRGSQDEMQ